MVRPSVHLKIKAPAKINFFLNVLQRRPDGYHDLYSVLQMVGLYDELIFEEIPRGMTLVSSSDDLPVDDRNLVIQAACALGHVARVRSGVRVSLKKNIPIGAGLGGGSSDAAATLVALNRLWKLGFSRGDLANIGQDLGSDVPFFLYGPAAFVSGRGEKVIPCVLDHDRWLVIINPGFKVSTRWVYEQFSSSVGIRAATQGERSSDAPTPGARPGKSRGSLDLSAEARATSLAPAGRQGRLSSMPRRGVLREYALDLGANAPQNSWLTNIRENIRIQNSSKFKLHYSDITLHNDLESVTESKYPVVRSMKECLLDQGAEGALMSGSGPTVFGVFKEKHDAFHAVRNLKPTHPDWAIWAVKSLRRSPI
jgi:4-diphosphocytidyl-2C-methyl-D-erythritol kinase